MVNPDYYKDLHIYQLYELNNDCYKVLLEKFIPKYEKKDLCLKSDNPTSDHVLKCQVCFCSNGQRILNYDVYKNKWHEHKNCIRDFLLDVIFPKCYKMLSPLIDHIINKYHYYVMSVPKEMNIKIKYI